MCGIVGYIGSQEAAHILVDGLRRLEYRGYDSAGIAVLNGGDIQLRRAVGKLPQLEDLLKQKPVHGTLGLGHTRWATHGRPCEENAHPHICCKEKIVVVHNGIIENYVELKRELMDKGHVFKSQTDTEVLAHLIEDVYTTDLIGAVRAALGRAQGSYALGVMCADDRERFVAARKDSPLVLGVGQGSMLLASDVPALLPYTRQVIFLEDGDVAELQRDQIHVLDAQGHPVERAPRQIEWDAAMAEKAGFQHFMLKEIYEQRLTIYQTFKGRVSMDNLEVQLGDLLPREQARAIPRVCLIGCGTSYHAALVARHWFEEIARIPCDVEIASEQRYRRFPKPRHTLAVAISQSGETADTLAALREAHDQRQPTMAICNAVGSTLTRDADATLHTFCGPEIGVASTKAFTGQLTALFLLALYLGQCREAITRSAMYRYLKALSHLPYAINHFLENGASEIATIAKRLQGVHSALYLGRHLMYPIALEGALKLKEIAYVHAEGYPAGEMKHGPIALIDEGMPVIALALDSHVHEKMLSNIEEVKARGGQVIAITTEGDTRMDSKADAVIRVPRTDDSVSPILAVLPLQLLAYHAAVQRGCDVDQPRNLAKSVTVE
jgi:glucosamine--fructose-6-phosphate aminotransferase (isomerizing)